MNPEGFHYIFKENFEKKKIKEDLSLGKLLPKQSNITQNFIYPFTLLVYLVDEAIVKNDGAFLVKKTTSTTHFPIIFHKIHPPDNSNEIAYCFIKFL